jgi:Tol biopolymer transport system component
MLRASFKLSLCKLWIFASIAPLLGATPGELPAKTDGASGTATAAVTAVSQVTHDGLSKTNLLSSGSKLYVTETQAGRHVVAKISVPSSDRTVVDSPFSNFQALDVSPDGSRLLISPAGQASNQNEFWVLPMGTGNAERLGNLSGRDAAWSVDGEQLVFGKGHVLCLAKANGTEPRELFRANGSVFGTGFSTDGRKIRFTVGNAEQNTTSIWEIGTDGSNPHPLVLDGMQNSNACCGSWTGDGRYYVFQSTSDVTTLWALPESANPEKAKPLQLTRGPMSFGNPASSADNKAIWAIGVQPTAEAVQYDTRTKQFVPMLSGVSATDLDYTSDGKWVAYVAIPERTLWRSRADGSERLQLSQAPERAALPHWSPDGKRIAFVSAQAGKPWRISIISAEGGRSEEVLNEDRNQVDTNWSPDGTRMMFGYVRDVPGLEIRIAELKTHATETLPGSQGLFSPRWSPDGKYVAALSQDLTQLMLFDCKSKKWTTWLTEPAGAVNYPTWSADSKYVYFDDLVTDEESIRRVKVGDSHAERVFAIDGLERYPGPFGLWSGRTANGSWMFVRDRSTQEVYQLTVQLP